MNGVLVWGFTGIILNAVLEELGWAQPWDTGREVVFGPVAAGAGIGKRERYL